MGNIHVKLYEMWTSGSGGDVVYRVFYLEVLCYNQHMCGQFDINFIGRQELKQGKIDNLIC